MLFNKLSSIKTYLAKRFGLSLILLTCCLHLSAGKEESTEAFNIIFRLNSAEVDMSLDNNANSISDAVDFLNSLKDNPEIEIVRVSFCGAASPEGPYEINRDLANRRLKAIEKIVRDRVDIPQEKVTYNHSYIPWDMLKQQIQESDMASKEEVLDIINGPYEMVDFPNGRTIDSRVPALQALNGGTVWKDLNKRFFSKMRMGCAVIVTAREVPEPEAVPIPPVMEPVVIEPMPQLETVEEKVEEEAIVIEEFAVDDWYRKMYIKTNVPAWAMLWQNIALEVDLAKHWSFAVPVYWSPYNYGKQTLKFRTLAVVPELRYWPKAENMGFFVNAHFGMAYYNYAKDGDFRYQDHDGKTPALGGGIGIGYRFYFCRNHHWTMEAAVGAGVYHLDYDIFENADQTKHGYLLGRRHRTFYGIDQAAFTISYSFGLRKKYATVNQEGGDL